MNPPFYASKAQKGNTVATYYQQTVLKLFWASLFSINFLLCIRDIHNACLLRQVPCQSHAVETPSQMVLMINSDMDTFWASQCLDHLIPVDSPTPCTWSRKDHLLPPVTLNWNLSRRIRPMYDLAEALIRDFKIHAALPQQSYHQEVWLQWLRKVLPEQGCRYLSCT